MAQMVLPLQRIKIIRIKIIEPYNLMSTVLTVALWLGNNDYGTVKICTEWVFKQLKGLQADIHQ